VKTIIPQKVYENGAVPYAWNFEHLGISFFEVPKTGSSSTKTLLFRKNFGIPEGEVFDITKNKLKRRFPDAMVRDFGKDGLLDRILIIYRDPLARAKSTYRHVFLKQHKHEGPMSKLFETVFEDALMDDPKDAANNHYKPMTWFFPKALLDDPRSIFIETKALSALPDLLGLTATSEKPASMPHLLKTNKYEGEIDMTDDEIKAALGPAFDDDFAFYEKLSAIQNT